MLYKKDGVIFERKNTFSSSKDFSSYGGPDGTKQKQRACVEGFQLESELLLVKRYSKGYYYVY